MLVCAVLTDHEEVSSHLIPFIASASNQIDTGWRFRRISAFAAGMRQDALVVASRMVSPGLLREHFSEQGAEPRVLLTTLTCRNARELAVTSPLNVAFFEEPPEFLFSTLDEAMAERLPSRLVTGVFECLGPPPWVIRQALDHGSLRLKNRQKVSSIAEIAAELGVSRSYLFAVSRTYGLRLGPTMRWLVILRGMALFPLVRRWKDVAARLGFRSQSGWNNFVSRTAGDPPRCLAELKAGALLERALSASTGRRSKRETERRVD